MSTPVAAASLRQTERLGAYGPTTQVMGAIRNAAAATGVSFNVLASKAAMESGFRADAQAGTSSARGLFQFIDQTWLSMVRNHGANHGLGTEAAAIVSRPGGRLGVQDPAEQTRILALRNDPELSARFAAEYMRNISESLTPVLGRRPDATELYLGHFLGTGGATKMLQAQASNPAQAASAVLPAAAAANPRMFNGPTGEPLTVAQFTSKVRGRLDRTFRELGMEAPRGPVEFQPASERPTTRAVAGEPGGWGNDAPARFAHGAERTVVAALSKVFSRMGRGHENTADAQSVPASLLAPLRPDTPAAGRPPGGF